MYLAVACWTASLGLFALAARPLLARYRARRAADAAERRAAFKVLLADAEHQRLIRQQEAEGDQIPWR